MNSELAKARRQIYGPITSAIFFSVFTNLLMLTGPLFMLQVYDRVLGSRAEETLVVLMGLVVLMFTLYGLLEFARGRVMARVGTKFQLLLNARIFQAVLERAARPDGKQGRRDALQDLESIRNLFSSPVLLTLLDAPWTPLFLIAIFFFHPFLGWLAVAGGGVLIIATILNQLMTRQKIGMATELSVAAQRLSTQAREGADLVWAQGMRQPMTDRWRQIQEKSMVQILNANDWNGTFSAFSKAFRFFLQSAILALGAWLVLRQELTPGAMVAVSILLGRALAPVERGLAQWTVVQRARNAWKAISNFLEETPPPQKLICLPTPKGHLCVKNLTVAGHSSSHALLSGVSFEVPPGQALGVIGNSGAGKTTLARAIVGLISPAAGEIRLDKAKLEQYGSDRLGAYIGYLPQSVRFFPGTVAENIARMAVKPDTEKIIAAALKARVHEVILNLPDGYNTQIGTHDTLLSGGQKQRLALARALYNDPVLLVLDEPNSALDADGSEALNTAIREMKSDGRAIVIMTHRPMAISSCDTLLMLSNGKVAKYGPRDEVVRSIMQNASGVQQAIKVGGHQ